MSRESQGKWLNSLLEFPIPGSGRHFLLNTLFPTSPTFSLLTPLGRRKIPGENSQPQKSPWFPSSQKKVLSSRKQSHRHGKTNVHCSDKSRDPRCNWLLWYSWANSTEIGKKKCTLTGPNIFLRALPYDSFVLFFSFQRSSDYPNAQSNINLLLQKSSTKKISLVRGAHRTNS